jgi:hypothetical protein
MIEREDFDPAETREYLDALDSVEAFEGVGQVDARRKRAKLSLAAVALPPSAQSGGRQQALRWNCRRNDPIFRVTPLASFTKRQTDPGRSYWRGRWRARQSLAK